MLRFCPKCGIKVDSQDLIDNFCINCYIKEKANIKIPDLEITFCVKCGKIKYQSRWFNNLEDIERNISKNISIQDFKQAKVTTKLNIDVDGKDNFADIQIKFIANDKFKVIKQTVPIKVNKDTCLVCSRISGNYYTSILQIRFDSKKIQSLIEDKIYLEIQKISNTLNTKSNKASANLHIVKYIKQKTGFDIYLDNLKLTYNMVIHLMKHKSAREKTTSKTLVGVSKNGQRVYRTTFCVHFSEN